MSRQWRYGQSSNKRRISVDLPTISDAELRKARDDAYPLKQLLAYCWHRNGITRLESMMRLRDDYGAWRSHSGKWIDPDIVAGWAARGWVEIKALDAHKNYVSTTEEGRKVIEENYGNTSR